MKVPVTRAIAARAMKHARDKGHTAEALREAAYGLAGALLKSAEEFKGHIKYIFPNEEAQKAIDAAWAATVEKVP